ncbi:MAG TPA: GntR family transcriptional regulator [Candidatus Agathobaculum intestinipullorum]|nr:GntR family transcriptional regulator [uncultured Agathobaculum sp.]HJA49305.1 GntR family transcriptional regulator [Candidatus Agathobaculum intestinipullorum]
MQWQLRGDRPIYQQLVEILTEQIVSGQLEAGGKVPAVRELAAQAGVNPNTMQRALADMEREGLMYTNRTSGRYVTEDKEMIQKIREQIAGDRITEFLVGMSQLGFSEQEVYNLLKKRHEEGNTDGTTEK